MEEKVIEKIMHCVIMLKNGEEICERFELVGTAGDGQSVTISRCGFHFGMFQRAKNMQWGCTYNGEETIMSIPVENIQEMYLKMSEHAHIRFNRRRRNARA